MIKQYVGDGLAHPDGFDYPVVYFQIRMTFEIDH